MPVVDVGEDGISVQEQERTQGPFPTSTIQVHLLSGFSFHICLMPLGLPRCSPMSYETPSVDRSLVLPVLFSTYYVSGSGEHFLDLLA